jgi:pyridoxal phosphate enzyme (YggS family)
MLIAPHNLSEAPLISANMQRLRATIAAAADQAHRTVESITVIAVSKGHGESSVRAAAACGVLDFGESYAQEAKPKIESLRDLNATWHFIGRLQANKSRVIAECFDWVHGVDRLKIAERLSSQRPHYAPPLQVCLQVNILGEIGKGGVEPRAAAQLALSVRSLPGVRLRGLMCILPAELSAHENRQGFRSLRTLLEQINLATDGSLDTLSMGMSADYREAILEGATSVRVGTAIFGPRPPLPNE